VGQIFQGLFSGKDCMVLCSATLTVAGSFDYLQASLGFEPGTVGRTRWLRLASPFDYAQQSLLLVATDMATPTGGTREHYLAQLEEVVAGVCELFPKGVLVLFNSHRDLRHIASRLPLRVAPERILVQGESGSRHEIAETFRSAGDKVLLATRSFWEGFDVSGEALSCVVLAKLPFANFRDPIHAGRQRAIDAAGGDSFRQYSLPIAVMQLRQGFGRLIRSKSDYGCVFVLDSRVVRARYGRVFLDSLPGPQTVTGTCGECLEAAAQFMEERRG
jgi:ATP-dependent DNA helicase DinG